MRGISCTAAVTITGIEEGLCQSSFSRHSRASGLFSEIPRKLEFGVRAMPYEVKEEDLSVMVMRGTDYPIEEIFRVAAPDAGVTTGVALTLSLMPSNRLACVYYKVDQQGLTLENAIREAKNGDRDQVSLWDGVPIDRDKVSLRNGVTIVGCSQARFTFAGRWYVTAV